MTKELLSKIIDSKPELAGIPVIANVNFGHTLPLGTLPIGGQIKIDASNGEVKITVVSH